MGTATSRSLDVDGQVDPDAVWAHRGPEEAAAQTRDRVASRKGVEVTP